MAELLGLHIRLFGTSNRESFENAVGDVAKFLTHHGVDFAISSGRIAMDAMELVGRELMKGVGKGDVFLPNAYTVTFPNTPVQHSCSRLLPGKRRMASDRQ